VQVWAKLRRRQQHFHFFKLLNEGQQLKPKNNVTTTSQQILPTNQKQHINVQNWRHDSSQRSKNRIKVIIISQQYISDVLQYDVIFSIIAVFEVCVAISSR